MKRFVAALLGIVMLLTLCACGGKGNANVSESATVEEVKETLPPPVPTSKPMETPALVEVEEATGWVWDGTGWRWVYDNGLAASGGRWEEIDGKWYFFNTDGYAMQNQWMDEGDYRYWFKDSCAAAMNETLTIDGVEYTFDADCHLVQ